MELLEVAGERAGEIDHAMRAGDEAGVQVGPGDVGADELDLAQIGERFELERLLRVPADDPEPGPARQQFLRDIGAEIAVAADQDNELVGERS